MLHLRFGVFLLGFDLNKAFLQIALFEADDALSARKIELNADAVIKRQILQSIVAQYDPMNYQSPCLNRVRLFKHALQCDKLLSWDTVRS
ncbi:hypothetical protein HAZT_HAZT003919 [Hyalella azteca]|uniref:Uncharacterized protein n=1 Tax=Hyalella azteca TaxID=294128 RepID=A0A6A0GY02_HYAAZ|nr:hypothetical protein HAZT_HAZT003919 [Hyalella azteca]